MSNAEKFVAAYWAWKRRERTTEPTWDEFGLHEALAELLAQQVHIEFEDQVRRRVLEANAVMHGQLVLGGA